jgi:hypothetical protein
MSQTQTCQSCGASLALDQRYCLDCGTRVAAPRLDVVAESERSETEARVPLATGAGFPRSELQARRDALARELTEQQWDFGGLAYEMAIRDHFRLDVLVRQAGRLQALDARLGEVEHLLRLDAGGAAGACPRCDTLYARGALYCSHCALQLVEVRHAPAPAAPTAVAPAAPGAPYGILAPDDRAATVAFEPPVPVRP